METSIVKLTTQDITKALPVTDSKTIAEIYGTSHHAIQELTRKYINDFNEFGKVAFQMRPFRSLLSR
jgi:phage regulator Rha-like protein